MFEIIKQKKEEFFIFVSSIIILIFSIIFKEEFLRIYFENNINSLIISYFGYLFGFILTAYTILFGLVPNINKNLLETKAFESLNVSFFISLVISLIILVIGFIMNFFKSTIETILIYCQFFLTILLIGLLFLNLTCLYLIFKNIRKERLSSTS